MEHFASTDLKDLVNLLNLNDSLESDDDEYDYNGITTKSHPNSRAYVIKDSETMKERENNTKGERNDKYVVSKNSKDIWSDDEIMDEDYDEAEMKERPEYEMIYQQNVTPDDIYLQLSDKGPGSNSCEYLNIKINLPNIQSKSEITLKISALTLICKTKCYYLDIDFPRHVDPGKCTAKWNQSNNSLLVQVYFGNESILYK